ncbi:MAG TPA: glycosyltransferase family 4 protein, partial [Kiritimatiellia bacterium]|nr:glycosyltransferase family 4 protein [Kiritimatiellia bacterium]
MERNEPGKPLRVLFVNRMAGLERGGGETFDLEISRHLAQAGAQVTFLCGAPLLRPAPMPVPGARALRTPWLRRFPWDKVRGGWRVRQLEFEIFEWRAARWIAQRADEFDVIQVCELPNLVHWLKRRGVKTPVVMRLTAPNYYDPRGGVAQADALIASGASIERLRERGQARVVDVPNAVDAERFRPQPSDFRKRRGIGRDEFVALYVARFQAFKNHALLIDAFARFVADHPAARLLLAGSGPLRERTEQQAAERGLADKVLFLGEVPYAELPAVYAAADAMAISSDYESFCFAAIEAMAMGLPVLTTDCAWVPRLVADGAGLVVPVGDPAAFAAGLKKLADNPALRQRLGAAGRQHVLERHTW